MTNILGYEASVENGFRKRINKEEIFINQPLDKKWNPFLSDFLHDVSSKFKSYNKFYPDLIDIKSHRILLTDIYKIFNQKSDQSTPNNVTVLSGHVGIGKSSFINWFRDEAEKINVYIALVDFNAFHSGVDEKHSDSELLSLLSEHILKLACSYFINKLQSVSHSDVAFSEEINKFRKYAQADNDTDWNASFLAQSENFKKKYPQYDYSFLTSFLIAYANREFKKPLWIVIDNVDRLTPRLQRSVIDSMVFAFYRISENNRANNWNLSYQIILMARPETLARTDFDFGNFNMIEYPRPRIIQIAQMKLFQAMNEVVTDNSDMTLEVTIGENLLKGFKGLSDHIQKSITDVFAKFSEIRADPKDMIGTDIWHLNLVHNNIRRFIKPWSEMILSGNFQNDLVFPDNITNLSEGYSVHRYLKMLLKGRFNHYPGNYKIDGYGYSAESPLFFNLFGLARLPGLRNEKYAKNYLIFIRILQYLLGQQARGGVKFSQLNKDLGFFFDKDIIENALKELLWGRLIVEVETGARDIGPKAQWNDIVLQDNSVLLATETSELYYLNLLPEYDYISTMSMVSYQLIGTWKINSYNGNIESIKVAESCLHFLSNWLIICLKNYENYERDGHLDKFKSMFLTRNRLNGPWEKCVRNCINSLSAKKISAEKEKANEKIEHFSNILDKLTDLRTRGQKLIMTSLKLKNS